MIIKPELFSHTSIQSVQSTRLGGISTKPYDSMNLGVNTEDTMAVTNLQSFYQNQKMPHAPIFMNQVHSNSVVEYLQEPIKQGSVDADACFTSQKNVICCVLSADCLPVLIADKNATVVAAVHCGWRGLYTEILQQTILKLNVEPKNLQCWLGPCISYKPYRVDEKFRLKFIIKDANSSHCFYRNKKGGWHCDLKKIAVYQLEKLGVKEIMQTPYCTYDNKAMFFSYRRDGVTGRMASFIWIN